SSMVTSAEREARYGQKPATILLTGLTGAGKSTIAYALERRLFQQGRAVVVLDGQAMRRGISKDLGFTADDRSENLRRSAEVARLMNEAGLLCIAAFVAPDAAIRDKAAEMIGRERFLVVHLDCPLEVCRQRDTEGHYQLADRGELAEFPGVSAVYERPVDPQLVLPTDQLGVDACVDRIVQLLSERGLIG
ncbi:MAG: adenylyl-sulfate kinase, partial [Planctomycetota bacterium]